MIYLPGRPRDVFDLCICLCCQSIPEFCEDQLILVELVSSIRVIPIDNLVQTVRSVVRQPPNIGPSVSETPVVSQRRLVILIQRDQDTPHIMSFSS